MPLISAIEDLKNTTLRSIEGVLAKLEYFMRRRQPDGRYEHWGLTQVHGDSAAQQALTEAHRSALAGVLRTPLRDLAEEAAECGKQTRLDPVDYVESLSRSEALPPEPGAGAPSHLRSVLRSLSALLQRR